jgi:hypothetical protein
MRAALLLGGCQFYEWIGTVCYCSLILKAQPDNKEAAGDRPPAPAASTEARQKRSATPAPPVRRLSKN